MTADELFHVGMSLDGLTFWESDCPFFVTPDPARAKELTRDEAHLALEKLKKLAPQARLLMQQIA